MLFSAPNTCICLLPIFYVDTSLRLFLLYVYTCSINVYESLSPAWKRPPLTQTRARYNVVGL
jgi:hypothetical protein